MSDTQSIMEGDASWESAGPDEWGSAVLSGDATKLAELVLVWSGSKPERALSILRDCVALLEKEVEFSAPPFPAVPSRSTTPGPDRKSWLNAFIVGLDETCDGKSWYTSTKELQLASIELCVACRKHQTPHLIVDTEIPRRLLAAADAPPSQPKRLFRTRVPRLRARRVTWDMPTAAELRKPIFAMTDLDCLEFGDDFEGGLEAVAWPQRLKTIEFVATSGFNKRIDLVQWPPSLQRLEFGGSFFQPIEGAKFPPSLQDLTFFAGFNHPIGGAILPSSLLKLDLGSNFNHPIEDVAWPPSLRQLAFGEDFNQPIELATFPASLKHLIFDAFSEFDQPIRRVAWPTSLEGLAFGICFNQPIEGVVWPDSLQRLCFGICFDQPIDNVKWPASLQELTVGFCLGVACGGMIMRSEFNQRIGSSAWPASLRRLTLGHKFRQSLQGLGTWTPNLESLRLLDWDNNSQNDSLLRRIEWPKGLLQLTVFKDSSLEDVEIPATVEVLHRYNTSLGLLSGTPNS
ncbi:unnamed protein product [Ectocarpus sp. 8 AP-2014]